MSDLNLEIDDSDGERTLRELSAAVTELKQALVGLAASPTDQIRSQLKGVTGAADQLVAALDGSIREARTAASVGGASIGKALAAGMLAGMDVSAETVKDKTRRLQIQYEQALAKGWKARVPVLLDLRTQGISLSPEDRMRIQGDKLLAASAGRIDPRVMLGLEPAVMQKSAQASAEVFKDAFSTELARARSAGRIDPRTLLGLEPAVMQRSAQAAAETFKEAFALESARARSASPIDARVVLGLQPDELRKSAQGSAAVFQEAFAVEAARAASAGRIDPRTLLGLEPVVMQRSAQASAEVFKEAFARETARARSASNIDVRTLLGLEPDLVRKSAKASASVFEEALGTPGGRQQAPGNDAARLREISAAARTSTRELHDMHSAARGVASGFNAMWLTWGNLLPLLSGAAVSNAFVQSVRMGAQFQQTLTSIGALAGQSQAELEKLIAKALELGLKGPFGPLEMANALKTLALAGQTAQQQLESIGAVRSFAIVGETDMKTSAEGLVAIATAYGYSAENFSVVGDIVAKTAASSMASVSDMTEAFRQASVVAQQYGVTLEDTSTTLALLSQLGITGSAAGTAMRNMYTELMGTSKKARQVLDEHLGVKVWDDITKSMKPLPQIMEEMSAALSKFDSGSIQKLLIDLGNERGTKALVANLQALSQTTTDASGKVVTQFQKIRDEVRQAPGYMAVAAAVMEQTTLNLGKSVSAALETALIDSFRRTEPAVQALALRLRELFASEDFRAAVSSLAGTVASFLDTLVKSADTLAFAAKAYVTYKAAALGAQVVTAGLARAVGLLTLARTSDTVLMATQAYRGMALAATAGTGATGALAAAVGAVGPAASRSAVGVRLLIGALGPLTAILTGAYVAWTLFSSSTSGTAAEQGKSIEDIVSSRKGLMSSIDEEIDRLKRLEDARNKGIDSMLAEARVRRDQARESISSGYDTQIKSLASEMDKELAAVDVRYQYRRNVGPVMRQEWNSQREAVEIKYFEKKRDLLQEQGRELARIDEMEALSARRHAAAAKEAEDARRRMITGSQVYTPDDGGAAALERFRLPADNLTKELEKRYSVALQMSRDYHETQRTILENAHQAEAISLGTYRANELSLIEAAELSQLNAIQANSSAVEKAYQARRQAVEKELANLAASSLKPAQKQAQGEQLRQELDNLSNSLETFRDTVTKDQQKLENSLLVRTRKQADEAAGALRRLEEEQRKFLLAESRSAADRRDMAWFDFDTAGTSQNKAAVLRAEYDERKRLLDLDRQHLDVIRERERDLADFTSASMGSAGYILTGEFSPEQTAAIKAMNDELERMRQIRQAMADAAPGNVGAAGEDAALTQLANLADIDLASVFDSASVSIHGMNKGLGDAADTLLQMAENQEVYEKARKAAGKDTQKLGDVERRIAQNQLKSYGDLTGALKGYFKEGTKGYKALETAETAFRAAELASALYNSAVKVGLISTQTAAVVAGETLKTSAEAAGTTASLGMTASRTGAKAVEALVAQLTLPFPANIPAFAMVAAMLAALGVATGAIGGTSGSFAPTNDGTGTVLGDPTAKSESIKKSIDLLDSIETISGVALTYTRQMAASLRNLEGQIGGVASLIVRGGTIGVSGAGVQPGFQQDSIGSLSQRATQQTLSAWTMGMSDALGLGEPIAKFVGNLFGTKTKITGQGLSAGPQSLQAILDGALSLQSYTDIEKKKKTFGITTSTSRSTTYAAAGTETTQQFTLILQQLADSVRTAAMPLATSTQAVQDALSSYVVSLGRIDLKDLNGEQIQERLTAVFSAEGDRMARAIMPGLDEFQAIGEGYLETLVRVSSTTELVNDTLATLGNTMFAAGISGARLAVSLVDAFGGLENFQSQMSGYYQSFYSEEERAAATRARLSTALQGLGFNAMPETRDEFRKMVDDYVAGGGLLTEAGQEVYAQLIELSGPFAELTDAADEMADSLIETSQDILDYVKKLSADRAGLATPMEQLQSARTTYVADLSAAKSGDVAALERLTSSADAYIEAQKAVTASSSYTQAVISQIIAELTQVGKAGLPPTVPAFAAGGYHGGGWALVGEEGPEYAYFDSPARIYSAKESAAMGNSAEVVTELRAVKAELAALRAQQGQEHRESVNANLAGQRHAAEVTVKGYAEATERTAWVQNNKPEVK